MSHPGSWHHHGTMGRCPECGADRLVPLSFQAARVAANDLERPEVVAARPIAKCGGCGARIYLDRITHRHDPSESADFVRKLRRTGSRVQSASDDGTAPANRESP